MTLAADASRWVAPAEVYDAWFDRPWGRHASAIEQVLLLRAGGPVAGRTILDAGCGTGRFTRRLEAEGARVIGVDRDPAALAIARQHSSAALVLGDVHALALPDRHVDVVFAVTVCEFVADPGLVIAELVRVTRPGGLVVVGSLNRHSPWGWWNRRQFDRPPWDCAQFLDRDTLVRLGSRHGHVELHAGLYSPRALPLQRWWAPPIERLAGRVVPTLGAFQILTIRLPASVRDIAAARDHGSAPR